MQQVKFFKGLEADIVSLERDMNTWLKSNGVKVANIFGNIAPQSLRADAASGNLLNPTRQAGRAFDSSDIFIAVLYETK